MATATRMRGHWLGVYTGLVILYLFTPIIVMIVFGFNDFSGRFNFVWEGFTLDHWKNLFDIPGPDQRREALTRDRRPRISRAPRSSER